MSESARKTAIVPALLRDWAFVVAAAILLVFVLGWRFAVARLGVALAKAPVPWPAHVTVDDGFRNTSFPKVIGPYARVEEDGVLFYDANERKFKTDGQPDGETIHDSELLATLGMGTGMDKQAIGRRESNWYVSRICQDTRVGYPNDPYRFWRLDVAYYTGGLDTVPHVPEVCGAAGGATLLSSQNIEVVVPGAGGVWNRPLQFRRVVFEAKGRQYVQYYIFSLNGEPETERLSGVRRKLLNPLKHFGYFAKIQVDCLGALTDSEESDRKAVEFLKHCLPIVLKDLPSAEDVDRLEATRKSKK